MNLDIILDKITLLGELNPVLQIDFFIFGLLCTAMFLLNKRIEENKILKEKIKELNIKKNKKVKIIYSIEKMEEIENYKIQ